MEDRDIREFVENRIRRFRDVLESEIRGKVGAEVSADLRVRFQLSLSQRLTVKATIIDDEFSDLDTIDTSKVPRCRWIMFKKIQSASDEVSAEAIAAAAQRTREPLLRRVLQAYFQNSNTALTGAQIKKLGGQATFLGVLRQQIRVTGAPVTIARVGGKNQDLYKLFTTVPHEQG